MEPSSVEPIVPKGGGGSQNCALESIVLYNTERVCKGGLLVVVETIKEIEKPWRVLIDFGAPTTMLDMPRLTLDSSMLRR